MSGARGTLIAERIAVDSPVVEDYLKVIWAHTEWQPRPMTSGELATRLRLAPS